MANKTNINVNSKVSKKVEIKCLMCPKKKGSIRIEDAAQCLGCKNYMHQGCTKRTITNFDGSFQYCCGIKSLNDHNDDDDTVNLEDGIEKNPDIDVNISLKENESLKIDDSKVDDSLKPLLSAIQETIRSELNKVSSKIINIDKNLMRYNENLNKIVHRLDYIDSKVTDITQRIINLESKQMDFTQEVFIEVKERISKESNIIVYKYQDSIDAHKTDIIEIKEIFKNLHFLLIKYQLQD